MKDPKPTKKELASQAKDLEEQITRLKNRLNGQVFKKTKHGYRLDQLSEGAQQLGRRVGDLEQQLFNLGKTQEQLAEKWQELGRDADTSPEKSQEPEPDGKKNLKKKLAKLKESVSNLSQLQIQIGKTLGELQEDVGRVGNVRDDLKLETDQLRAQVRKLEENSSRYSVTQAAQEARTLELEGLLAELTLKQEKLAREEQPKTDTAAQQPEAETTPPPLAEQLQQQLGEHTSEDIGRHKEVDRRLQELANRIGDLGGHFNHLQQDIADQRQQREYLKQELDLRLQQLEKRISGIDTLETQFGTSLKSEADALWQKLEQKGAELEKLRERLEVLSDNQQGPELNQKLSGVEAEVSRLSETGDFLQESFQGLGGLELNLTSRLDDIQRQLQEHIGHNREFEEALHRLSGEFGELNGNLQKQLEQSDRRQHDRLEELEQKQALLTDWELNFDSHRQEIDGQLNRIEESITAERERISQLEENFARASDQAATQAQELEQARRLQLELQSRFEDLNEDFANQTEQGGLLTARVEEQVGQLQALTGRIEQQAKQQSTLIEERKSNGKSNRFALVALLLLGLLGGALLYFSNVGKIAEIEQQIAQQLTVPSSNYVTQQELADKLGALQTSPGDNEKSVGSDMKAATESLLQRQSDLEQQFADLEVKLNLLAADDSGKQQQQELERIQQEIKQINSAFAQLSAKSSSDTGEARLAAFESSTAESLDQLARSISQLEARPVPDLERLTGIERVLSNTGDQLNTSMARIDEQQNTIGKIERSLGDTGTAIEKRLDKLETGSTGTNELLTQLQSAVQALAASRESPEQKQASLKESGDSPAIWQEAAETGRYTIQLAGSRSKSSLIAFAKSNAIEGNTAYFRTVYQGRHWFILLYGPYSSFGDASKALENLPPSLNRYRPWIRRIPSDAEFVIR